jgi:thimet oligopeptidase
LWQDGYEQTWARISNFRDAKHLEGLIILTAHCCVFAAALLVLAGPVAAQEMPKDQPPLWSAKPDIDAFEKTENGRLAAAQRSIEQLVAVKGSRTIENTLAPYDEAFEQIDAAGNIAELMQQVHPNAAFRDHATAMNAKASGAEAALSLNGEVYKALVSLDVSQSDSATRYFVQRLLRDFRLAGVEKDDATRAKLKMLQDRLTAAESKFKRNISDDTTSIEVADVSELEGLPQDYIDKHKAGADGKIHIMADEPDSLVLLFAKSDKLRRNFSDAFESRAYPKNREVLEDMMQTRYEIAQLLGYPSWADSNAADKMIGNGKNIATFLAELGVASRPAAEREFAILLAEKQKTEPGAKEILFYQTLRLLEMVRRSQYDFDSESVRPYLPYNEVKQGIMSTAATLFHITFQQEMNVPAWDPSVETWDVIDNGKAIGRFYLDMHPRPGKYGHAAFFHVLDGIRGKQLPEGALVCNFPMPTATEPGLMEYDDVVTFFHEFGHLLHYVLGGQQQWAGISGISMEGDFVEAPSKMLEEWMRSPQVLASFAHHYKTGEPIPVDLVARMNRASAFGRGTFVNLQTGLSAVSYDVYKDKPEKVDLDAVASVDLRRFTLLVPTESDSRMYANFDHLADYSSRYYTYLWDKVIAEDFFQQFDQHNLLAGNAPLRYRRTVLEPGGSMSANDLVKNFLGRPQNTAAFQRWMNEEFESAPKSQ